MHKYIFATLVFLVACVSSAQALCISSEERSAQGRKLYEWIKGLRVANRISQLDYLKQNYVLDRDYFCAPMAMLDLDLYNIMMAKNVEIGRITQEEYEYYANKKIEETTRALTTFD